MAPKPGSENKIVFTETQYLRLSRLQDSLKCRFWRHDVYYRTELFGFPEILLGSPAVVRPHSVWYKNWGCLAWLLPGLQGRPNCFLDRFELSRKADRAPWLWGPQGLYILIFLNRKYNVVHNLQASGKIRNLSGIGTAHRVWPVSSTQEFFKNICAPPLSNR